MTIVAPFVVPEVALTLPNSDERAPQILTRLLSSAASAILAVRTVCSVPFYHCFGMVMQTSGARRTAPRWSSRGQVFDPKGHTGTPSSRSAARRYGVPTMFHPREPHRPDVRGVTSLRP